MEANIVEVTELEAPCRNCGENICNCEQIIEEYNDTLVIFRYKGFKILLAPNYLRYVFIILLRGIMIIFLFIVAFQGINVTMIILVLDIEYNNLRIFLALVSGYVSIRFLISAFKTWDKTWRLFGELLIFQRD